MVESRRISRVAVGKQQFQLPLEGPGYRTRARMTREQTPPAQASASGQNGEPLPKQSGAAMVPGAADGTAITPTFVALTDLPNLRAAGITYPSTIHGWRWLFRHRHERGLQDAFRRIGRRIVVDPQRYHELVRKNSNP